MRAQAREGASCPTAQIPGNKEIIRPGVSGVVGDGGDVPVQWTIHLDGIQEWDQRREKHGERSRWEEGGLEGCRGREMRRLAHCAGLNTGTGNGTGGEASQR